jgi:hypothetical protein
MYDGVMINGNTIIAHALAIARKRNIHSINGSLGWLHGFLKRRSFFKLLHIKRVYS